MGECGKRARMLIDQSPERLVIIFAIEEGVIVCSSPATAAGFPANQARHAVDDYMAAVIDDAIFHTEHAYECTVMIGRICLIHSVGIIGHVHTGIMGRCKMIVFGNTKKIHMVRLLGVLISCGRRSIQIILCSVGIGGMRMDIAEIEMILCRRCSYQQEPRSYKEKERFIHAAKLKSTFSWPG